MRDSVTLHLPHPPERVWTLLSDVTRIGELSPETYEGEWLDGATVPAVGARFRGHVNRNNKGVRYWTECRVTACEPGRTFGFDVVVGGRPAVTWRYDLAPAGDGTDVTESFALDQNPLSRAYWAVAGRARGRTNRRNMLQTLQRAGEVLDAETGRD